MAIGSGRKILSLGKSLKENIDDAYEKFITGGGKTGKNKKITIQKKDIDKKLSKQEQVKKAAENKIKKQKSKKVKKENVLSKDKQVNKAKQNRKAKQQKSKQQSTSLVPTGQSKTIKETVNPKKIKQNFKTIGKPVDKTKKVKKPKKQSTALVTVPSATAAKSSRKILNLFDKIKKNKGKIGAAAALSVLPFAIGTDKNVGEGKSIGGGNKDKKPKKEDFTPKIKKPTVPDVKEKKLPKTKSNDYTGRFIDKEGNVAYDSASDFFAHMFGTPKKRKMPKTTARIIGKGDKLKRKKADTKGAGKGVKFQAFKSGTGNKTVGLKDLPPKSINPGIHKLPAKAKMNMGFKPMSGGGLIASFYDKPEKTEKYKGNTTSARQVKGYGKAKKKA